jgi:hypothetical protein
VGVHLERLGECSWLNSWRKPLKRFCWAVQLPAGGRA